MNRDVLYLISKYLDKYDRLNLRLLSRLANFAMSAHLNNKQVNRYRDHKQKDVSILFKNLSVEHEMDDKRGWRIRLFKTFDVKINFLVRSRIYLNKDPNSGKIPETALIYTFDDWQNTSILEEAIFVKYCGEEGCLYQFHINWINMRPYVLRPMPWIFKFYLNMKEDKNVDYYLLKETKAKNGNMYQNKKLYFDNNKGGNYVYRMS